MKNVGKLKSPVLIRVDNDGPGIPQCGCSQQGYTRWNTVLKKLRITPKERLVEEHSKFHVLRLSFQLREKGADTEY